jgi:hemerythrin-like domain-containing protein
MSTRLTLHATPAAGFDEPFEMLLGCHERVERMLGLLERLAAHLDTHGCDDAARQAAQDVMRYFDLAGPAHHEDEERHVLPLLAAGPDAALQALAQRLQQDHRAMTEQWRAVRADLAGVADGRWPAAPDAARAARWRGYAALYRDHVRAEEAHAFPAARARLDADAQAAMGREMAARRGAAKA